MKIVIVEDELKGRILIRRMLGELGCEDENIKDAESVKNAVPLIQAHKPALVFLDVELGDGDGFDVLQRFPDPQFKVVFITGYDHYAIKALQHGATDYILKPILFDALEQALERVKKKEEEEQDTLAYADTIDHERILVKLGNKHIVYAYDDICALEADQSYSRLHLKSGSSIIAAYPLGYFIDKLKLPFLQIHRSWMINLKHVLSFEKGRGGKIILSNSLEAPVATRRKSILNKAIKSAKN